MPFRTALPTPPREPAAARGVRATLLALLDALDRATPSERAYARLEARARRGRLAEALAGFEAVIAGHPGESVARLHAAELHVRAGNPRRAEALLREVQRQPARTDAHDLRASNRLVDLYLGPLDDPASAVRELRRIADAHAGTPVGDGARDAMRRLRATEPA